MPFRLFLLALLLGLAALQPVHAEQPRLLQVMLQGESAQEMAALVQQQGGTVTHYLPIIRAVGARLSREQLDAILASEKVQRHIDDLALEDQPLPVEPEVIKDKSCEVGGAVEIQTQTDGFSWMLFNKRDQPVRLERVQLDWPKDLGRLQSLSLGVEQITLPRDGIVGPAEIEIHKPSDITLNGTQPLRASFSRKVSGQLLQRDISLQVSFSGGCDEKLIPGYPDNLTDFYYAGVVGAANLHHQGVLGDGITVAVLDSGLWEHPDLTHDTEGRPRIPARYDAMAGKLVDVAFDESGHGTHLTSTIANSAQTLQAGQPSGDYRGIAPDARIIPIKAFNVEGQGSMLDIVRGIQWVVDNRDRYSIRVLNLSFAARPRWPYYMDPIDQAVMQAWADGIVVVAAAGNEGPEPMTVGSPGNTPYIITVGVVTDSWTPDDRSDDYIPDFSSRGPTPEAHIKPDLVAPGGHITGIIRPDSGLTREHPEYSLGNDTFVLTGSSQSAAVVSGLVALLLQIEPDLTPDDVKCKLITGADPAINRDGLLAYSPFVQGHGYVNIARAILLGERGCGNQDMDITSDIDDKKHFEGPAIVNKEGDITLPGLARMLSKEPPEKGTSHSRAWGVKTHIERLPDTYQPPADSPFDWARLYREEKSKVEAISAPR